MKYGFLAVTLSLLISFETSGFETDQYSTLFSDIRDSTEILDSLVGRVIKIVVDEWEGPRDDYKFARLVAGSFDDTQVENWINNNPQIDSINNPEESIYRNVGWIDSFSIRLAKLCATFSLNNVQIGSDKVTHFMGVGIIYYQIAEVEHSHESFIEREKRVIAYGLFTEKILWGALTSRVLSNADLVANYEGYLFFLSLFREGIVNGKKAIISWQGDRPTIQRKFTFRDHVNDYWSEALNPNKYGFPLRFKVRSVLRTYCDRDFYRNHPERFVSRNDEELFERYSHLGIERDLIKFRLDRICEEYESPGFIGVAGSSQGGDGFRGTSGFEGEHHYTKDFPDDDSMNSQVSLFSTKRTILPPCIFLRRRAGLEFDRMTEWNNEKNSLINNLVRARIENLEFTTFGSFVRGIIKGLYRSDSTSGLLFGFDGVFSTAFCESVSNLFNLKIKIHFRYLDEENIQVCTTVAVPHCGAREEVAKSENPGTLKIRTCFVRNLYNGRVKETRRYIVTVHDGTVFSIENYMNFNDRDAYIYRVTPKICKWL